jgi:hypothetical protein
MSEFLKIDSDALDRHITGNYGEDQLGTEEQKENLWHWLENGAEDAYPVDRILHDSLSEFYTWGLNYDMSTSPFNLFRDLVGWSEENIGGRLYDYSEGTLGYLEAGLLSKALDFWSDDPRRVEKWLDRVSELELADYDVNG